jgi:hypothetical protein
MNTSSCKCLATSIHTQWQCSGTEGEAQLQRFCPRGLDVQPVDVFLSPSCEYSLFLTLRFTRHRSGSQNTARDCRLAMRTPADTGLASTWVTVMISDFVNETT